MSKLLHELPLESANRNGSAVALRHAGKSVSYADLAITLERVAGSLLSLNLARADRVAVYLPKQPEAVYAYFGIARAGCVFVPVNPLLRPEQVGHILRDCNVRVLITTSLRANELQPELATCGDLGHVLLVDAPSEPPSAGHFAIHSWSDLLAAASDAPQLHRTIDIDMAAILYTSGSTGKPKGVVLSHRNMVTGAHSVSEYLGNRADDVLLAALPFSFDYGFSQLSTAFAVGARVVLMEYLFAKDVLTLAAREAVTGLAGVPPIWVQLAELAWPEAVRRSLRYITNSGGAMPGATLRKLRASLPNTQPFLMYGLTEAFRSTYLPPAEVDRRPDSIGKAIPNAEIMVVRPDGAVCAPDEPGELVHRGSLVALGYWNDPTKTAERFKPVPGQNPALVLTEMAVWSGDTVRADADGYLYFVGRRDEMIKTSGYRVSPTELEEVVYATGLVVDAVAIGIPHPVLGQAIVIVAAAAAGHAGDSERLLNECKLRLPTYMVPAHIAWREALPRNPNGKFDRPRLVADFQRLFQAPAT